MCSCPSQKGHAASGDVWTGSSRKSLGRFRRSVEMITQRPVTGSLRSSDIESVPINLDARDVARDIHVHHVEPARAVPQPAPQQIVGAHAQHPALLQGRDRVGAVAEGAAVPGLHLHNDDGRTIAGDDINFSVLRAIATGQNCVPSATQFLAGEIFTQFSKILARVTAHRYEAVANSGPFSAYEGWPPPRNA